MRPNQPPFWPGSNAASDPTIPHRVWQHEELIRFTPSGRTESYFAGWGEKHFLDWKSGSLLFISRSCYREGPCNQLPRRGWKRLKGCVYLPPCLCPVPARGRKARKRNLSIASLPIPLRPIFYLPDGSSELEIFLHKFFGQKKYVLVYYIFCVRCSVQVKEPLPTEFYDKHVHSPLQSVQSYTFFTESRPLVAI